MTTTKRLDPTKRLTKALSDAIPLGPHPTPHAEWISVRLDFVQEAIDHLDWLEKGVAEWRDAFKERAAQAEVTGAAARMAIMYLDRVLNQCKTHAEQQAADTEARDWLASIGH